MRTHKSKVVSKVGHDLFATAGRWIRPVAGLVGRLGRSGRGAAAGLALLLLTGAALSVAVRSGWLAARIVTPAPAPGQEVAWERATEKAAPSPALPSPATLRLVEGAVGAVARERLAGLRIELPPPPATEKPGTAESALEPGEPPVTRAQDTASGGPQRAVETVALPAPDLAALELPAQGEVLRGFGWRQRDGLGGWQLHAGIDIASRPGIEVHPVWAGRVTRIYHEPGEGAVVVIAHGGGWETIYGGLSFPMVSPGDSVDPSTLLGTVVLPALGGEPHVHFGVRRNGQPLDPAELLE